MPDIDGLIPEEGVRAVDEWLSREDRSRSWLADRCAQILPQGRLTRHHLGYVLRREREISPRLASAIAEVTGIDEELLQPLNGRSAVAS